MWWCSHFAVFPILINTYQGVRKCDKNILKVARSFRSPEWKKWEGRAAAFCAALHRGGHPARDWPWSRWHGDCRILQHDWRAWLHVLCSRRRFVSIMSNKRKGWAAENFNYRSTASPSSSPQQPMDHVFFTGLMPPKANGRSPRRPIIHIAARPPTSRGRRAYFASWGAGRRRIFSRSRWRDERLAGSELENSAIDRQYRRVFRLLRL